MGFCTSIEKVKREIFVQSLGDGFGGKECEIMVVFCVMVGMMIMMMHAGSPFLNPSLSPLVLSLPSLANPFVTPAPTQKPIPPPSLSLSIFCQKKFYT